MGSCSALNCQTRSSAGRDRANGTATGRNGSAVKNHGRIPGDEKSPDGPVIWLLLGEGLMLGLGIVLILGSVLELITVGTGRLFGAHLGANGV